MNRYVVRTGDVFLLAEHRTLMGYTGVTADPETPPVEAEGEWVALPPRETYGQDWTVYEAADEADALAQAEAYDARRHPAQVEMELFAAAYAAGAPFDFSAAPPTGQEGEMIETTNRTWGTLSAAGRPGIWARIAFEDERARARLKERGFRWDASRRRWEREGSFAELVALADVLAAKGFRLELDWVLGAGYDLEWLAIMMERGLDVSALPTTEPFTDLPERCAEANRRRRAAVAAVRAERAMAEGNPS